MGPDRVYTLKVQLFFMPSIMVIRPAVPVMTALMRTAPAAGVMPAMAGGMAAA